MTSRGLLRDSSLIAAAAGLSRVTGLVRIIVAASVLGSTVLGDLFVAVNVLPLTLYDVVAGSAISSVLVPPLVRLLDRGDRPGARRLAASALGLVTVAMAVVTAIAIVGRGWIASALTSGVEHALIPDAARVAGLLVAIIVPQLLLYAAIGVFVSIQHAHRRFLVASAAPIVENVGLMVTVAVVWSRYGGGREVTDAPPGLLLTLGLGSGLSVLAHAAVQYLGARRAAGSVTIALRPGDPAVRALARPVGHSFGWSSVIALRQFALIVAASYAGSGGVQAFEIATLAYFIPLALIGRPVASAALPRLARASTGPPQQLVTGYLAALRLAAWAAVPAGLALIVLSGPTADLLARGRFDDPDTVRMLGFGLTGLGLGAASEALFEVARQATMATGSGDGLRRSTWIRAVTAIVGLPLAVLLLDGPAVLLGLGLAVSAGDVLALLAAHRGLLSGRERARSSIRHGPRIAFACALALGPASLAIAAFDRSNDLVSFGVPAATALVLFVVAATVMTRRGRLIGELGTTLDSSAGNSSAGNSSVENGGSA
ncbi:MAG: hypothetical protein OEV40_08400 [Acidimicrobiia bacterium]|nr:hypothetical protein [Acidimicrobiia bacterium]